MTKFSRLLIAATMLTPVSIAAAQSVSAEDVAQALEAAREAGEQAQLAAAAAEAAAQAARNAAAAANAARDRALQLGAANEAIPVQRETVGIETAEIHPQSPIPEVDEGEEKQDSQLAFSLNGYMRSGWGTNNKGGAFNCFGLPGVNKFRLGNECDTLIELGPKVTFPVSGNVKATYHVLIGFFNSNTMAVGGAETGGSFDVRQNYMSFEGFGGALDGASIWAGRRYYQRHAAYITDLFYWSQRAQGAGVENIRTPAGNLSLAVMRVYDGSEASATSFTNGVAGTSIDTRLAGIKTNKNGSLELGVELRTASSQGEASANGGFLLTGEHVQKEILGGRNTFVVQYGSRAGANLSTGSSGAFLFTNDDSSSWRVLDDFLLDSSSQYSANFFALYQRNNNLRLNGRLIDRRSWFSMGVRPQWHWNDNLGSAFEVGFDRLSFEGDSAGTLSGVSANLLKFTVVPVVLKLKRGYFERPEMRFYGTCARWNGNADLVAVESGMVAGSITGNSNYVGQRSGCSIGAQIEAWW